MNRRSKVVKAANLFLAEVRNTLDSHRRAQAVSAFLDLALRSADQHAI